MKAPEFSYARGIARCTWTEPAAELKFDLLRLDRRTGELSAELTVVSKSNGHAGLLHRARLNLGSTRSRADFTNHLSRRLSGPDWPGLVEAAAWKVIEAYRQGPPAFLLRDAVEPAAVGWALKPLAIARDSVILFGDGGDMKSYTVLTLALGLQTGVPPAEGLEPARPFRVAYLDFEWSPLPHKRRLRALCGAGELPEILYVPCQSSGPLTHQVERLQRIFEEYRIDFAVLDSVGLACDGPPEEAQSAITFNQAIARLEVGTILVAHTSKESDMKKPFGSAYWHNSARMTWYVKRIRAVGTTGVDVGLYNRKFNDGALLEKPIGLHFEFADGSTTVSRINVEGAAAAAETAGAEALRERLVAARRAAGVPMTYLQLAVAIGLQATQKSADLVRVTVQREPAIFTLLKGRVRSQPHLVSLVQKASEHPSEHPSSEQAIRTPSEQPSLVGANKGGD